MTDSPLRATLRDREPQILAELAALHERIQPLEKELGEVRAAMRAIGLKPCAQQLGEHRPTIKQIVLHALADRPGGVTIGQLLQIIEDVQGYKLARPSLSPQLTRLMRERLIENRDGRWRRVS